MADWREDISLHEELKCYVEQNMKRSEIVDFVRKKYPQYCWSVPTLARRLKFFQIKYVDNATPLTTVREAVQCELQGPGKLLGYRAMNHKLRTEHHICVPRNLVADVLFDLDPDGVGSRNVKKRKKTLKRPFISDGPGWTFSLDRHDKMMGYQNSTFPLAVYGCLDTFSRKIIFLKVWTSNSDPNLIGKFYTEYLLETKKLPMYLRMDRGSETGVMATIHAYLVDKFCDLEDSTKCIEYGKSTSNKIERWWKDLHERFEKYLKEQCRVLLLSHLYDPSCTFDRKMLSYIFIPVVQRECDTFCRMWNSHRIRHQSGLELPTGIPNHMFSFPEKYNAEDKHINITEESLEEVSEVAHLDSLPNHYLTEEEVETFTDVLPDPLGLKCNELVAAFKFLKSQLSISQGGTA